MVRVRLGAGKLGCLVSILVAVAIAYFAADVGEVYMRYYRYRDAMAQEARFFERSDDESIRRRLIAFADSLDLPSEATRLEIDRTGGGIVISARWSEAITLPFFQRELHFAPRVERGR